MSIRDTIKSYDAIAAATESSLNRNPFADGYQVPDVPDKQSDRYGRPPEGSKTEKRGIKAGNYVYREVLFLCEIIDKHGVYAPAPNGGVEVQIKFGHLFDLYATYSDKVVGMLLRARKYGLVDFEGEMLFQRRDDHKIVTMLMPLHEIRERFKQSNDPKACIALAQ